MNADAAGLLAIEARCEEIASAIDKGGLPKPEEQALRQERMDLERERRKLLRALQPDGGKQARALSVFASWYKQTEGWGYVQPG